PKVLDGQISIPEVEGLVAASEIAAAICSVAGATLQWECPDFPLHYGFSPVGRPLDLLQRLVRPFSLLPEMRRVDVFALGGQVVYCRQRALEPVAATVNTISIRDARIRLRIRKFQTDKIGLLSLQGMSLTGPSAGEGTLQDIPQLTWESPEAITYPTPLSA